MATLWIEHADDHTWEPVRLAAEAHSLASGDAIAAEAAAADEATLHALAGVWVVLGPESVRINGLPLFGGVRVLRHADELRAGARHAFFADDDPPQVAPFAGADPAPRCPRCTRPVDAGTPAVRSRCGLVMHQSDAWPCFSHAPCPQCPESTDLSATAVWSPEVL